jgi:deoxyribonuclease-4
VLFRSLGAVRMVVHPGSCSHTERCDAMRHIKAAVPEILKALDEEGFSDIAFCPETMGRLSQAGTLPEVIELCKLDERLIPAIDFGHLYARSMGGIKTAEDFKNILDAIENGLGFHRLDTMHCHFSKIEYTAAGEKRHLTFDQEEFGPDYLPLLKLFADKKINPVVICESRGTMAKDALSMKTAYEELLKGASI